jgi:NADPH:quinone reductase-like Zn-dependent oxidoreductase
MTALQALDQVGLRSGERLLVNGAAGGVGSVAVQIGRALGAEVTGVCSASGASLVGSLGATVLDYAKGELGSTQNRFDVVLDTVSSGPSPQILRVMDPRARYLTTGFTLGILLRSTLGRLVSRRRFGYVMSRADGDLMRRVSALVAAGKLRAIVSQTFPLARIAEAHAALERGHVHGKIVVTIP